MANDIVDEIEACWERTFISLMERIKDASHQVGELLRLEEYYRSGHQSATLGKSMGGFGAGAIDLGSLAAVLGQGDERRLMEKNRYTRVCGLRESLSELGERYDKTPPLCRMVLIDEDSEETLQSAKAHLDEMARTFRLLRMAELESRAKYDPPVHDDFFARFDWEHLSNDEVGLCPPFVVLADGSDRFQHLPKMLNLLSSGKPVKIVLRWSRIPKRLPAEGRSAALQCAMDIELLPVALRGAYVSQGSAVGLDFQARLAKGLLSPRPAVFSLFAPPAGTENGFHVRSERAVSSRVFPNFVYDPDRSMDFVDCFDLSGNPAMRGGWPRAKLKYRSEKGESAELEREYTFADFAVWEEDFKDEFSQMPADLEGREVVHIAKYIDLPPDQRGGKIPFVYHTNQQMHLTRLVPSMSMILQTADRLQLWRTLKELAGIENPHVLAAEEKIRAEMTHDKEESLKTLRAELSGEMEDRERNAVTTAMGSLARRLAGLATVEASAVLVTPAPDPRPEAPAPLPAAKKKETGGAPWIQSKKCTTCDECTNINPRIFAYDKNKKAYIHDPKGGAFRDIVKAAKACSAKIIHPGKPLDPDEKDLEKWIKQAEPFQ